MKEIFVPALGMALEEVLLVSWAKKPGDEVAEGEIVAVIETDKSTLDVESPESGRLGEHLFPAGTNVAPGVTVTYVLAEGESAPPSGHEPSVSAEAEPAAARASTDASATADKGLAAAPGDVGARHGERLPHRLSPRQRRLAKEAAAIEQVAGAERPEAGEQTASSQRVEIAPPAAAAEAATANGDERVDRHRRAVSEMVTRSWQSIPHFVVSRELRAGLVLDVLADWRAIIPGLTLTDLLLRAYGLSLVERLGTTAIDLGLAVATNRGVAIPVIRDVPRLDLAEIANRRAAAVDRARAARLGSDDAVTPASSLSNLGGYGIDNFTGVIPLGQTSLLTVGRARPRPVVEDGQLAVASTVYVALNVDHRTWDGQHAGEVLQTLQRILLRPRLLAGPPAATNVPRREET